MKLKLLFLAAILTAANPILAQGQPAKTLPIRAGTPIQKGDKYISPSGNHQLLLQNDGNLVVQKKDGVYVWGLDKVVDKKFPRGQIARVELRMDGSLGLFDAQQRLIGTIAGGVKKGNLMLTVSFDGALQVVAGDQIFWASDGNLTPPIKVGVIKADIKEAKSELMSEPGWDQCWVMRDPTIKIFVTKNVSKSAINAVANIYAEMTKRLDPSLDPMTRNPKSKFNGFKVYLTNEEYGNALKQLSGVKTFWSDGGSEKAPFGRDFLLGGARGRELWITEQMICKTGVKTRAAIGKLDKEIRTFDQVVHEFAHSIDMTFDLQKKDNIGTVFNGSIGPVEGFAWGVQHWFGVPGGTLPDDQKARLSRIFSSRASFSPEGYGK